ncbi:GNAT family N-acetyltransferase [Bradyrhizobium commune]|uniref:GNAT family N-acetyltransferase n=1 Tax=Bradyrhizobium commune TaxID=83627 RepID=A0A7S9D7T6_9BRAD|nr:GNAT family N-acetyltransferase [Bradyrhizobium commune]QPF92583.1 GNAT family N-acetyltransferase [Bradyrhizobium commune]
MKHELFVDWSPDSRDHAALLQRLANANLANGGPGGYRNIAIIIRDSDTGEVTSGVWGIILYGWLLIDLLFVAEADRRQGLGSRLLAAIENAARDNGCLGCWLSMYAFQTPGFCSKNGYELFSELGTAPAASDTADQRLFFYRKALIGRPGRPITALSQIPSSSATAPSA